MRNQLKCFKVHGFRSLDDICLDDLARVNVFVGKNGSGKTSALEALYAFFSEARIESLIGIAERRGEYDKTESADRWVPSLRHFFTGHSLQSGNDLISFDGDGTKMAFAVGIEERPLKDDYRIIKPTTMCSISRRQAGEVSSSSFPIGKNGAMDIGYVGDGGYNKPQLPEDVPSVFVSPDGVVPRALLEMRDDVVSRGAENELVAVLKILDPRVESVGFLSADVKRYEYLVNGTLVGLSGMDGRVPVKTLGDGMRRLLIIAMAMICARGGVLLLDEIDSGLHYSAMHALWDFILKAAEINQVQVFASTHSLDCLRGLAATCEESSATADSVRLYSFSNISKKVVAYSGRDVSIAIDNEIEVRA